MISFKEYLEEGYKNLFTDSQKRKLRRAGSTDCLPFRGCRFGPDGHVPGEPAHGTQYIGLGSLKVDSA